MTVFFKFAVFLISLFLLTAISGCDQAEEATQAVGIEAGNGEEQNNGDEKEDGDSDQEEAGDDNDDR